MGQYVKNGTICEKCDNIKSHKNHDSIHSLENTFLEKPKPRLTEVRPFFFDINGNKKSKNTLLFGEITVE